MSSTKAFKKTVLGVSLIHGQFTALAVVKGHTAGSWVCPDAVETTDDLRAALHGAIQATHFPGRYVSLLIEGTSMLHQYHLVPPMTQPDLERYLERMVNQDKPFPEPAVWRYRKALPGRERTGLLLDVVSQSFVDDVVQVCHDVQLTPLHLFPLSAVFVDQVRILAAEPDDLLLLVTIAAGKLVFVVATGDGTPLFDRFLQPSPDGAGDPERIGREINRSILFAKQQLGQQVKQVWVMGDSTSFNHDALQPFVSMPLLQSPMSPEPSYWIWVGVNLPPTHASNFIPKDVRTGPARRTMAKVSVAAIAGLVCASVSLSGFVEGLIVREHSVKATFQAQSQVLAQEKKQWQQRHLTMETQRKWIQDIQGFARPPVTGWFLSYLSTIVPDRVVLTKVSMDEDKDGWLIELTGQAPKDFRVSATELERFEQQLTDGPYHFTVTNSWRENWIKDLQMGTQETESGDVRSFMIIGRLH